MKKQTAIQNLIEELKQFKKFPMVDQPTIQAAIDFAELRLEEERDLLKSIYGVQHFNVDENGERSLKSFEQWYEETFNTK
jgi:hypothetical protein